MTQGEVLAVFEKNPTKTFTAQEITDELHAQGITVSRGTVNVSLKKLRKKPHYIEMIEGYSTERKGQKGFFYRLKL